MPSTSCSSRRNAGIFGDRQHDEIDRQQNEAEQECRVVFEQRGPVLWIVIVHAAFSLEGAAVVTAGGGLAEVEIPEDEKRYQKHRD